MQAAPFIEMKFVFQPFPQILCAGQPSLEDFKAVAAAGYRTVINTRGHGETGVAEAPALMAELGMAYHHIPMNGAAGVTLENAQTLADLLTKAEGPILVHCGSSNRVGALFALKAFFLDDKTAEDAMAIGKSAGMLSLTAYTASLLVR